MMQHVIMTHVVMQQCRDATLLNTCDAKKGVHLVRIDDELEVEQIVHVREFSLARLGQL